ncbi:hypothetical protein ACFU5Z_12860 [Streptomyces sp. NPDC057521]|uniref:hypothetical protein n=1 Tax=Streptomyces sp. NPDC057521 TaxID=3346156 RepID=UPI0036B06EC0
MIAVSSPRISLMGSPDRTDTDTVRTQERRREPAPLERSARSGELVRLRQQFRREATERRDRQSGERRLRVLAYSLVTSRSATPDEDWNTLQAEAEQRGYTMGARFHDVAVPVTTTYLPGSGAGRGVYTSPWKRPGWGEVERLIRGGFADGVIVLDRHNISSDDDEYRAVIKELGERYQAFIHLVIPEKLPGPT